MMSQRLNIDRSPGDRRTAANAIDEDVILDAAASLMSTIGIRRATMADVARAADVSRATLYRRFENIEALAAQVTTREFTRAVATTPMRAGEATRESLIISLVHLVGEARRHPLLQRIIELDPEFLMPYLLHRTGRTSRTQLAIIEQMIAPVQAAGEIRAGDPRRMAATVLQIAWSFALTGPVFVDSPDPDNPAAEGSSSTDPSEVLDSELIDVLERYLRP